MKYFVAVFITAVVVFLGATVYYKGIPTFPKYSGSSVSTQSGAPAVSEEMSPSPQASGSATQAADENISIVSAVQAALVTEHGPDAANRTLQFQRLKAIMPRVMPPLRLAEVFGLPPRLTEGGYWFGTGTDR